MKTAHSDLWVYSASNFRLGLKTCKSAATLVPHHLHVGQQLPD